MNHYIFSAFDKIAIINNIDTSSGQIIEESHWDFTQTIFDNIDTSGKFTKEELLAIAEFPKEKFLGALQKVNTQDAPKVLQTPSKDTSKIYVHHAMDILDRIHLLIQKKFNGDTAALAKALNKSTSEVESLINGVQNFPLWLLSELEFVFDEPIITVVK